MHQIEKCRPADVQELGGLDHIAIDTPERGNDGALFSALSRIVRRSSVSKTSSDCGKSNPTSSREIWQPSDMIVARLMPSSSLRTRHNDGLRSLAGKGVKFAFLPGSVLRTASLGLDCIEHASPVRLECGHRSLVGCKLGRHLRQLASLPCAPGTRPVPWVSAQMPAPRGPRRVTWAAGRRPAKAKGRGVWSAIRTRANCLPSHRSDPRLRQPVYWGQLLTQRLSAMLATPNADAGH